MKGYIKMLVGLAITIIIFYVINAILSKLMSQSAVVSDKIAIIYKLIDMVELTKLNAKQALKFSGNKTLDEMGIIFDDLKNDDSLRQEFLDNLAQKFDPQPIKNSFRNRLPFDIEIDVEVKDIDVDTQNSRVFSLLNIKLTDYSGSIELEQEATIYADFKF